MNHKQIYSTWLLSALLCTCAACASTPQPQQLEEASNLLKGEEAQDLKTLRPKLIRQARQYEIKAKAAYERGDMEEAKLYAYQAIQKYQTARNFALRSQAQQLTKSMAEATKGLDAKEAQIALREKEKARYGQLKQSFESLRQEQQTQKQNETSTAAQARRTLLNARTLQAQVIGQNAIAANPGKYAQARLLLETALDTYGTKAYKDSLNNAKQAVTLLQDVLKDAKKQPKANTTQVLTATTTSDNNASSDDALAGVAKSRIDAALKAQSSAIAAGMDKQSPAEYAQAKFLLQSAETRLASKDYQGAQEKASQAQVLFIKGAQAKPAKTENEQSKKVLTAIQGAEDARAEAIQRQAKDASEFAQADYALDLARKALKANQNARALEKASQANLLFKQAQPPKREAPRAASVAPMVTSAPTTSTSTAQKSKVERMIIDLQVERADALGKLQDSTCPGPFKAFEALLALAQKRFDAGDAMQAFEFAIRASERLKQCQLSTMPTASIAKDNRETKQAQVKLEKERNDAATAIQKAQASYANLSTQKPGDVRLREPASLIANAQQWFKQRTYNQSQSLAEQAKKRIGELGKVFDKERKDAEKAKAVAEAKQAAEQKAAAKKQAQQAAQKATPKGDCKAANRRFEQAQAAKMRATSVTMTGVQEQQFKQNVMLLTRSKSMITEGGCDDAYLLASQAQSGFEFLIQLANQPKTTSTAQNSKAVANPPQAALSDEAIKAKMKAEKDRKKQEALANESIAKAKLWRSKVGNLKNETVFQTADQILKQAEQQAENKQWTTAAVMAEQAATAFSRMESESIKTKKAEEAIWKPAYAKVIEALQRRDEVKPTIVEAERGTFNLGVKSLARARQSWENRQFFVAGKFADAARASFDKAALAAEKRRAQEKIAAKNEANEAKRQQQLEREKEIQRKAQLAKQKAEEAKRKLAEQQAQKKKEEAEKKAQQRILTEDALRRASVSYQLCVQKACASRDAKAWLKSKEEYQDAQLAMKEQRYRRAQTLAASAKMVFDQTVNKPMPFTIDSSITRISRVGNVLVLSPKISFKAGGTIATPDSLKTINELAKVLVANKGIVKAVSLVGYTDARGKKQNNIKLSLQRAQMVKTLLTKRGVDATIISVDGKGPEAPVADNRTSKGREANRRVEVNLTWVQ